MTEEKAGLTIIQEEDGSISIQGNKEDVKKVSTFIAELFLKDEDMTVEKLDTLVDVGENLWNGGKCSKEDLENAKKFLEAAEKYSYPRATNVLSYLYDKNSYNNWLISSAMELRAAARGDDPCIEGFKESYEMQAELWRKKIAAAEGKPFEGEVPTKEDILYADRTSFFEIYEKAFNGNLDAMKTCLEFCEKEAKYWGEYWEGRTQIFSTGVD